MTGDRWAPKPLIGIILIVRDMDDATIAAKRHDAAAVEYVAARSAYESAVMGGDTDSRRAAQARMDAAASAYVDTLNAVVEARKAAVPSFEALLGDATMQADADSLILASIVAYSTAKPASAGLPARPTATHGHRSDRFKAGGWTRFSSDTAEGLTAAR